MEEKDQLDNTTKIESVDISTEVSKDFLEYAMSVIVSRALPDLKDGLKPVQRRIIYAMNDLGINADKPHKKSARIVGEVIGKYHPHGDVAVYDAMVRMAQDFSLRYPLIDGHGNFGSIDGDAPAAMRYTEARLTKLSQLLIKDINMSTVPYIDNYDASEREPAYLTGYSPNLLINGAVGIAVGMATSIPPHNLREVIDAIEAYINNNDITIDEILDNYIVGPDFPTGALMANGQKMREGYKTGRGSVIMRAKIEVEEDHHYSRLVISEIPYQTNKARIIERIAELVKDKTIEGISDIRDQSNYQGMRVVIDLKRDANTELIISKLYKFTALQSTFSINLLALHNNLPVLLDLKSIIKHYVDYQIQVIIKRSQFEKNKLEKRYHILEALNQALDNIDEIIDILRNSKTNEEAKIRLNASFAFDEEQNKAILDLKLQRLIALERHKIMDEMLQITNRIQELGGIIQSPELQNNLLKVQLNEIAIKFGDARRTQPITDDLMNIADESLIPDEKMLIVLSEQGYIRRLSPEEFRIQKRGGRGVKINHQENDSVSIATMGKTHDWVLFFTNSGKVYRTKGYTIRAYNRTNKGMPIVNFLNNLDKGDVITSILPLRNKKEKFKYLTFITAQGLIKRTPIEQFDMINRNGKIAIKLKSNDYLVSVIPTTDDCSLFVATHSGKIIRIDEQKILPKSRIAMGVHAIKLAEDDYVAASASSYGIDYITTISSKGNFKRSSIENYRLSGRNGKGIKAMNLTPKTGKFAGIVAARESDLFLIISSDGNLIKVKAKDVPILGRATGGVRGIRLPEDAHIQAVTLEYNKNNEIFEEEIEIFGEETITNQTISFN